jgi:sulfite exporter TauE/SafE
MPADTPFKALVLGIGWGWLPCGLVYSTLIWSSAAGSVAESTLLMLGFGLGTLPAMLATGLLAKQLRELVAHTLVRKLSGLLLILMGIWTLLSA